MLLFKIWYNIIYIKKSEDLNKLFLQMNIVKFNTNPNNRILWLVLAGYFVVCTYFILWTYHRQIALSEQSALVRLEGIVKAMAFQIDGDAHRELSNRFEEKMLFNSILKIMITIKYIRF